MAEETFDLIEETNDEAENWIYYDKDTSPGTNADGLFLQEGVEQHLICEDPSEFVSNDANDDSLQFSYDNDELVAIDDTDHGNTVVYDQNEDDTNGQQNDLSKHTLILKETINDTGQLVESYFCQECNLPFSTIEEFMQSHSCIEYFNENPDPEQNNNQQAATGNDKLWDLVENLEATDDNEVEENEFIDVKQNIVLPQINEEEVNDSSVNGFDLDKERYFCFECKQVFNDLTTAEQHDCSQQEQLTTNLVEESPFILVDPSESKKFNCEICSKEYTSLSSLTNHQRWHKKSMLKPTKSLHRVAAICGICNTIFECEKNLKLHMKMHNKLKPMTIQDALPAGAQTEYNELNQFFCEICNKSFDQNLLVIHKNMHQNLEEYNCGKCNKQFENLPSYEIHLQMHASDNNTTNSTKQLMPSNMLNDLIINTSETPSSSNAAGGGGQQQRKHPCQYCGKEFNRPYEKVKHERVHTGEKPYECEVCGKTFRVCYSLTLHLRTHTDIRPYACGTCNKRFKQHSVYVHHMKTHENERAYKCDTCGKSFRTSVQLSAHRNIHSKPYNCTECNRPFASLYGVKIHMKTHNKTHKSNKNLKRRCGICGASYARLFALRYHLKDKHNIDIEPSQLLDSTNLVTSNISKDMVDIETGILMNAAHEANIHDDNEQINYMNDLDDDDDDEQDEVVDNDEEDVIVNDVDHEENIQQSLVNNVYLDETEAATQTILNNEEIIVDNFHTEEIITDWLSK